MVKSTASSTWLYSKGPDVGEKEILMRTHGARTLIVWPKKGVSKASKACQRDTLNMFLEMEGKREVKRVERPRVV